MMSLMRFGVIRQVPHQFVDAQLSCFAQRVGVGLVRVERIRVGGRFH